MKKIAFIFPGQGSQAVGMGKSISEAYPYAASVFGSAYASLGFDIKKLCFEGPAEELNKTENTQPALLTSSIAALCVLNKELPELNPAFVAGHSLGEYSALVASGVLAFNDAVRLVHLRGKFMQEAVPAGTGKMAAIIGLELDKITEVCKASSTDNEPVVAANLNSPGQIVISGHANAVDRAGEGLKAAGAKRVLPLPVSVPSHSPLMESAAKKLSAEMEKIAFSPFRIPLVTNVEAEPLVDSARVKDLLARQLTSPVRWIEIIERLRKEGVEAVIEVGTGKVLAGLVKRIDKDMLCLNFDGPSDVAPIKEALGIS